MHAKCSSRVRLCNPVDCSPPGSTVREMLQVRMLEWVVMPSSSGSSDPETEPGSPTFPSLAGGFLAASTTWKSYAVAVVQSLCRVWLFATPWTATYQASLSFIISQSLLKLISIELMMPSNHLILCHPLLLLLSIFPNIRVFSNESALRIRWEALESEWVKSLSHVRLFATPWTLAHEAPPSVGFSRQEY